MNQPPVIERQIGTHKIEHAKQIQIHINLNIQRSL